MLRGFTLLMLVLSLSAGEAPAVPAPIKSTLEAYENDAERAYAAYQQAVAKAAEKAAKDMDAKLKAATKSGNLDLANAIKKEMDALTKGETFAALEKKWRSSDLLGNAAKTSEPQADAKPANTGAAVDAVVGKWGDGTTVMWDFKPDGTGQHFWSGAIYPITWAKNDAGYMVVVAGHRPRPLVFVDKSTINVEPGSSIRMK